MDEYGNHVRGNLLLLLGTSGVGKTTVMEYLLRDFHFETSKKFTTRPSRNTKSDFDSFIFCSSENDFPGENILAFRSYGHVFGIQIDKVFDTLSRGKNHVLIVGDSETVLKLKELFPNQVKTILLFCDYAILKQRVLGGDNTRTSRWETVDSEIHNIYSWLGCVDYLLDCSLPFNHTRLRIDKILCEIGIK